MSTPSFPLVDADNHYYEPPDCFSRHIEPGLRDRAVRVTTDDEGRDRIFVGERPFTFLENWSFTHSTRPGALREMLRRGAGGDDGESVVVPMEPAWIERGPRLARLDEQGVEACMLFPTLAVCVEHFLKDDADALYGNFRAFNQWLDETWGFDHEGRLYAAPLLSLLDLPRALEELERVLAQGARILSLRPGPAFGRSPADPHFDPFWARVEEAGATVAFHIGESGYNEMMSVHYGGEANPSSHKQSAFQWSCMYGDRPIMDTIAALVFGNLFGRYPGVRVLSVENGSLWVPYLMKVMDKMGGMGRNGPWPGGRIREKPSRILKRHVFVSPYHEEDVTALTSEIGATQVVFGSDYPHAEGLAEPAQFAETLEGLSAGDQRRILRDNALALLGRS